jgi:general secretion pathway protein F
MPLFEYQAVGPQGDVKSGQMSGTSSAEVLTRLQNIGLIPMSVQPAQLGGVRNTERWLKISRQGLSRKDIAEFTRQLSNLIGAGLPLDRALDVIREVSGNILVVELIENLQREIRGGATLSSALQKRPDLFADFYVNLVKAAEVSGNLAQSLNEISVFIDKLQALRDKLVSALVYPTVLVFVTLLSLGVIMFFVLPEFSQLFADMNAPLPAATAFLLGTTEFMLANWLYISLIAGVGLVFFLRKSRDPKWLYNRDKWLLTSRFSGDLTRKINMAFFGRTLGTLLGAGVPLLGALDIAKDSLRNRVLKARLEEVTASLEGGSNLAEPLTMTNVFPEFAIQMIQVGEETGKLDEMLIQVADIYDREVSTAAERMLSILEPVMIIGLGLVIGGIVMSILVAILGINDLPM